MAEQEAGWRNDPYGRFEQRYYDGTAWTEHVATGGDQKVDPLGASSVIPIVTPPTAFSSGDDDGGKGAGVVTFLDAVGPESRVRPRPSMSDAVAGLGGLLAAAALFNAILGDDASKAKIVICSLVSLAVGLVVRLALKNQPELRSAAVGLGVVGILGFVIGATDNVGDTGPLFLIAALMIAAWALPGFKGRPLMLGIGVLFAVLGLAAAFSPSDGCSDDGFGAICETGAESFFGVPASFSGLFDNQRFVYLIAGTALLTLVWWLDKRGFRGTATPLMVTALLSSFLGTLKALSNSNKIGPALLIIAVGAIVCTVGSLGERRATTWLGAFQLATGTSTLVNAIFKPESRTAVTLSLLLTAVLLIGMPALRRTLRARSNTPPPPPRTPALDAE